MELKYQIQREGPNGFEPTGEIFDAGDVSADEANAAAQARIDQLQQENSGVCYAAQIVTE